MQSTVQNDANFVFAKMKGFPQWPGVIIAPEVASAEVLAHRRSDSQKLVRFFRHDNKPGELQWFTDSDLVGFQANFQDMLNVAKGKTGTTYTHLRQSTKNAQRYFEERALISEDGSPVPRPPSASSSQSEPNEDAAEGANGDDASSDTSSEIKVPSTSPKPSTPRLPVKRKSSLPPATVTPSIVSPSPRMVTRRSSSKEAAATPDRDATPGLSSSQRKRPNGEVTPESGKKKVSFHSTTKSGTQSPSPNRSTPSSQSQVPNGQSTRTTRSSSGQSSTDPLSQSSEAAHSQSTDATHSQSNGAQSSNGFNANSPAKSTEVSMDITKDDASKEPTSQVSERSKVTSPSKVTPVEIENENVSELVRHLDYLGESSAPPCENIRAIADELRKHEGEVKQLLEEGFFHARYRGKEQNVVFSVETCFEVPNDAGALELADGRKVTFTAKPSSNTLKLLTGIAGPREIPVPGWFDVATKLACEFTRRDMTRDSSHQGKFALHWSMEIDHKFTYPLWLSSSADQDLITFGIKSIRVRFDVPEVKAVGLYEVGDPFKEIPGRNIKVTLAGVSHLKHNHPLNTFRKANLLVEYQLHWRNFLSLQIRNIQPALFHSFGLNSVEKEMIEDRIYHMKHAKSRRKYGGVTLVSKNNVAYGADAYVVLDKLNLNSSMKRVEIQHLPSWVVEAFLVTVYDGLWLKMGHLEDLIQVLSFATEFRFKDLQTVAEMVLLECLTRCVAFPSKLFSDSVLESKVLQQFLTAAFEETSAAAITSNELWLEVLDDKPELNRLRLDTIKNSRKSLGTEWTLRVKVGLNDEMELMINSKETVANLKEKIEGLVRLDRSTLSLSFESATVKKVFRDEERLSLIGVSNNDLVTVTAVVPML